MAENSEAVRAGAGIEQFGYKQELKRGLGLRDVVLYGVLFMVIIPFTVWWTSSPKACPRSSTSSASSPSASRP
mgnify:CR=1 FL=1